MSSWEIMLSKGQQWDWLGDPFWRVQTLVILFVGGLVTLIYRELRIADPVVNFRPLRERNFAACCIIIFCAYGVLYGASTSLPALLQTLFGYDAYHSGLVLVPFRHLLDCRPARRGHACSVGESMRAGSSARAWSSSAIASYWMSLMNLEISPWQVVWPRVVLIGGLSMIFAPLNVAAYLYTPRHLRAAAVGLLALLRNEGGSVGTSLAQTIQERREQFHTLRLGEYLDRFNPAVGSFARQSQSGPVPADGRLAARQTDELANARRPALTAGFVPGVFRCVLVLRGRCRRTGDSRLLDEAVGGRKRGRGRRGITGISPPDCDRGPCRLPTRADRHNSKVAAAKPSLPALPVNPSRRTCRVIRLHEKRPAYAFKRPCRL